MSEKFKATRWECSDCGEVVADGREHPPTTCKPCTRYAERTGRAPPEQSWAPLWTTEDVERAVAAAFHACGHSARSENVQALMAELMRPKPLPEFPSIPTPEEGAAILAELGGQKP